MPKRKLKAAPSCPEEVDTMRKMISAEVDALYAKCKAERSNFTTLVRQYVVAHSGAGVMESRVAAVVEQVDVKYDTDAWQEEPDYGKLTTAIMQWSFEDKSMWRGSPKNKAVYKLAKNMAIVGFRQDTVP